jgi:hypothetical protein
MPQPPETLLTIGEVAGRARHLARDPYAFVDRCRHWAKLGLLVAVENVGEGTGRHALFPQSEAYMAAVVNAFAEAGLQPAGSRPVADAHSFARAALAEWLRKPRPMSLEITFYGGGLCEHAPKGFGRKGARRIDLRGRPRMIKHTVYLSDLFGSVRAQTERRSDP